MIVDVKQVDLGPGYGDPLYLDSSDFIEISGCPACAAVDAQTQLAVAEGHSTVGLAVARCEQCTHAYSSRRPNDDWFAKYYQQDWDTGVTSRGSRVEQVRNQLRRSTPLRRARDASLGLIGRRESNLHDARTLTLLTGVAPGASHFDRLPERAKLLEVGAGYGYTLSMLQRAGFDCYGTEASPYRVGVCRAKGLRVEQTGIDSFDAVAPCGPFDVVYSAHVFEHLTDVAAILGRLVELIAPGGVLYIEVPNGPVVENLLHRTHVPVHAHFFSAASLGALLERHGLGVVRVLSDANLHVIAKKGFDPPAPLAGGASTAESFLPGRVEFARARGPVSYEYDHYHVDIRDDTGSIYSRPDAYGITRLRRPDADRLVNRFVISRRDEPTPEWPLRMIHDHPTAPIWVKRQ